MTLTSKERIFEAPEQFNKAKRALLLFCTLSFLLAVARINDPLIKISLFGGDVVISHWVLAGSLWLYCVYLFIGFWREKQFVTTVYSGELISNEISGANDALSFLGSKYQKIVHMLTHNEAAEGAIAGFISRMLDARNVGVSGAQRDFHYLNQQIEQHHAAAVGHLMIWKNAQDPEIESQEWEKALEALKGYANALGERQHWSAIEAMRAFDAALSEYQMAVRERLPEGIGDSEIRALIEGMEKRLGQLSEVIPARDRRFYFWYDLFPSYAMMATATIAPLLDSLLSSSSHQAVSWIRLIG